MKIKIISKVIAVFTILSICLSLFGSTVYAADLSLSKTKASLEVDATLKLSLGKISAKKVTWSSSNTKIATVSEYGTITAVKQGEATIKATYNKNTYSCKVTVVDNNATSNPDALEQGVYVVGEDLIAGKYDFTATAGSGILWIYESLDTYEKDPYDSINTYTLAGDEEILKSLSSMYSKSCKNIRIKKGYCIVVDGALILDLTKK